AYRIAKANDGAPGIDGVTFQAVEAEGTEQFLDQLREELIQRTYRPQQARKVEIPKGNGRMRQLAGNGATASPTRARRGKPRKKAKDESTGYRASARPCQAAGC
ncbi:MAG TPA: hypothetical protein VE621_06150, partial [Bryobacteraceae bacterium]|nr:hypothetical protein [Bryobacteraceae bacterium]